MAKSIEPQTKEEFEFIYQKINELQGLKKKKETTFQIFRLVPG